MKSRKFVISSVRMVLALPATLFGAAPPNFQFTEVTVPGWTTPGAFGLNNKGTIVRNCRAAGPEGIFVAMTDREGAFSIVIPPFAADNPNATLLGINNRGEIVGYYHTTGNILTGINDQGRATGVFNSYSNASFGKIVSPKKGIRSSDSEHEANQPDRA